MEVLYYNIDDVITIILEEKKPQNPFISKIYSPNLVPLCGFAIPLQQLFKENIYIARFQLPQDNIQTGTYIVFVEWTIDKGGEQFPKQQVYQIIVSKNKTAANNQTISINGI